MMKIAKAGSFATELRMTRKLSKKKAKPGSAA